MDPTEDLPLETTVDTPDAPIIEAPEAKIPSMLDTIKDQLSDNPQLERDVNGRFVRKQDEAKPLESEKLLEAPKPGDELTLPEGLSEPAQQRFQSLVSTNKEITGERDQLQTVVNQLEGMLSQSQIEPQDFQSLLAYGKAIRTGDLNTWTTMLRDQVRMYETATGQPFQAADPLGQHSDLQKAVTDGQITEAYALQLARARTLENGQRQAQQSQQQAQQQQSATERVINDSIGQVKTMCSGWMAKDLDWPKKQVQVSEKAQAIATKYPNNPDLWPELLSDYYATLQVAAPVQRGQGFTALRAVGSGGPMKKEPSSMFEAINNGLHAAG